MKKQIKKLVISRETLSRLDDPQLRPAQGGWGTMETECCPSMQPCSVVNCHTDTRPIPSGDMI